MKLEKYLEEIVEWLKEMLIETKAKGYILGVSGGLDSALVAALISKATPNCLGLIMPCHSSRDDEMDAMLVIDKFNMDYQVLDLTSSYDHLAETIFEEIEPNKLAKMNTMVRLRMITLYALGQTLNYLVVGTDNKDEWHTGYFTKHGDGGVDLVPIIHLTKRQVRDAARIMGVPQKIIDRTPSAGLFAGQSDEAELGITYDQLDDYLDGLPVPLEVAKRIEYHHQVSQHKRQVAPRPHPFKED